MDMASPEAPPVLTRRADDDAASLVSRIVDTQRWLAEQDAMLQMLPLRGEASSFMEGLAAFWQAPMDASPGRAPVTRMHAFTRRWAMLLADAARLGVADAELSGQARDTVVAVTDALGYLVPSSVSVRELVVGAQAYAGAVVVTDDRDEGSALLFMPDHGWESFAGLDALHAEVEDRLREALATAGSLPGLAEDDFVANGDVVVTSRAIAGNVLDALVANIVAVQRQRASDAWTWRDDREGKTTRRADRLHAALSSRAYLDVDAMLHRRQLRLLVATQETRLAQLPATVRQQWEHALADYRKALETSSYLLAAGGADTVASLDQFARDELAIRLRGRGVADDPADITIEMFKTTASTAHGYIGSDVERRPFIELARENFGFLEMRGMQARTAAGGILLALRRDDIVDMVRDIDLRNSYQDYLVRQFKTSSHGQRLRAASAELQQARMRFELADARSSSYIEGDTADFIDDHAERGYRWVEAILDAPEPSRRRRVENHDVVVSHIVYEGARLKDVLAIGVRSQDSVYRTILYTPDAPDGRSFREFADRRSAAAGFLHHPDFEHYLLERLPATWSTVGRDGVTRRFRVSAGTRRAVWALSGPSGEQPYTLTEGRFAESEIAGNVFDASYDVALAQTGSDVADLARSTGEADFDDTKSIGTVSARFVEGFLPVRLGLAVGSVRAMHALWRGIDHASRDDRLSAFADFVDAFSTAGDLAGSQVFLRSARRTALARVPGRPRQLMAGPVTMPHPDAMFDARYIAQGVRLKDARSIEDGVYEIRGSRYIEHGGQTYGVRFDRDNATWRLVKPGHTSADYAPPVIRDVDGQWRHHDDVGLRGGASDRPDLYDREPGELLIEYRSLSAETATLSHSDALVIVETLAQRGLSAGVAKRLIYDRTHARPTSALLARHWDAALEAARRPPPRIRTPPPQAPEGFELIKLERSQWPRTVWHYTTPYRHATFNGSALTLSQSLPANTGPSGLHVMTLDPGRPSRQIVEVMRGKSRTNTFTDAQVQNIAGAYVEIDLGKLRDRQRVDGTYEFNVYTVTHRSRLEFVIKPTLPAPDPRMAPLSPRRQRDLAGISLRPGEFRTGLRVP